MRTSNWRFRRSTKGRGAGESVRKGAAWDRFAAVEAVEPVAQVFRPHSIRLAEPVSARKHLFKAYRRGGSVCRPPKGFVLIASNFSSMADRAEVRTLMPF